MLLLAIAGVFIAGVLLASRYDLPVPALGLLVVASALLAALLLTMRRSPLPAAALAALMLGMLRVEAFERDAPPALLAYHGRPVQVRGLIINDPEAAGAAARFRLRVEAVGEGDKWADVSGDALVTLKEPAELARQRDRPYFRYGDRLLLDGRLERPPTIEDFDYPAYLAHQGIGSVMSFPRATLLEEGRGIPFYQWLYRLRQDIADSLARAAPEPQAALGQAMLLGLRDRLPEELEDKFVLTGTSHVLAISGMNISIFVGMVVAVSQWALGRRRQLYLVAPLILVWLYALISGMSPSVARAAVMGTVYLAALLLGRPSSILPALGLAAAAMAAINPDVLWSISFQLSFAAMAGIALLTEPISRWIQGAGGFDRLTRALKSAPTLAADTIAMTIAATIATLPLTVLHFGRLSVVGMPATLLAVPALPAIMVTHAAAGLVGLASDSLAQPLGWLAWVPSAYLTSVVGLFARVPAASVDVGRLASLLMLACYGIAILLCLRRPLFSLARRWIAHVGAVRLPILDRSVPWWAIAPAISLAALLWIAALSLPDRRLHVSFVDVGQGDAIFIVTPGGQQLIVDGGPDPMRLARFLGEKMPFRDRTIELMALTHPHADHVTGLVEALRRYRVQRILERELEHEGAPYQAWRRAVAQEGAEVIQAQAGQVIATSDGVVIEVLNPPDVLLRGTASDLDNAAVVLRLAYGSVSFLLTGDMFGEAEALLVEQGAPIDSDVLKVAHHGSRSSSSPEFLAGVSPAIAVISAGEDNRFGHPHPAVVEALRQRVPEKLLFVTRDKGTVEIVTDGVRLEVRTER
jgi:competence protein ComEC